jgi:hypothetical protein
MKVKMKIISIFVLAFIFLQTWGQFEIIDQIGKREKVEIGILFNSQRYRCDKWVTIELKLDKIDVVTVWNSEEYAKDYFYRVNGLILLLAPWSEG